jgi:hypothetical protein
MYLRESGARLPTAGENVAGDAILLDTFSWPAGAARATFPQAPVE